MLYGVDLMRDHSSTMYFIEADTKPDIMQILEAFQPYHVWYASLIVLTKNEEEIA